LKGINVGRWMKVRKFKLVDEGNQF
jgi:hypothetical protein